MQRGVRGWGASAGREAGVVGAEIARAMEEKEGQGETHRGNGDGVDGGCGEGGSEASGCWHARATIW